MNKSITQATQNDKQISKSIKRFFLNLSKDFLQDFIFPQLWKRLMLTKIRAFQ